MSLDGFPLFRLNSLTVRYWIAGGDFRRQIGNMISKTFKTGVVVLSPTLRAVGTVDPRGRCEDLPPPHRRFEMWQICNMPSLRYMECACRNYYDPEVQGPWYLRDKARNKDQHHPHCQFDRTAKTVWKTNHDQAHSRIAVHQAPQARPDEWVRTREEVLR
jgi:hypothetical protein